MVEAGVAQIEGGKAEHKQQPPEDEKQPEQFTGQPGKYVPLRETIRGFKEILEGKHDELPEGAFYMVGTIDEAIAKAEKMKKEA